MKKFLILGFMFFSVSIFAQYGKNGMNNKDAGILIEKSDYYGLSNNQKNQIITLRKNAGKDFERIGRDRSLSGYEKGRQKRAVSLKLQNDISKVLNDSQRNKWNNSYGKDYYNDRIDDKLDRLEDQYERDIDKIEKNYAHNKNLMKSKKNARKSQYKKDKERLKNTKQ